MADSQAKVEGWYRDHGGVLLRYLGRRFGRDGADDLLQETFVRALRRPQLRGEAVSARAWLFGIARHVGLSAFRRKRVMQELPEGVEARGEEIDPRIVAMREAIGRLPEGLRETLELRLADDLSYEEIAAVLGIPLGTVRSRLHHAVKKLREEMKE
ncbi:MAG TPA: RNA polymerase sigma factor [Tepidisphaeraceae bacterium]|jgi:RNA polymerase sigma-70 factor (ECF subfamily)|nr:RNA polymerase sigma factor [Tepidisphaeraceae bacterium]